jgi:hypothetical protein
VRFLPLTERLWDTNVHLPPVIASTNKCAHCLIKKVTVAGLERSRCVIIHVTQEKGWFMMSKTSKREYVATIRQDYRLASKATKGNLLSDLRRICGYNRKYAIRLMHAQSASTVAPTKSRAGRKPRYQHPGVLDFLKKLWIASNLACSKRLKAMIPTLAAPRSLWSLPRAANTAPANFCLHHRPSSRPPTAQVHQAWFSNHQTRLVAQETHSHQHRSMG